MLLDIKRVPSVHFSCLCLCLKDDAAAAVAVSTSTENHKEAKKPSGDDSPECPPPTQASPPSVETHAGTTSLPSQSWQANMGLVVGAVFFMVVGIVVGRWSATRSGYYNLSEAV